MTIERNRTSGQTGIHLSLLSAVVLALSLLGCIQAATAPSVPKVSGEPSNLLPNGSFEIGGKPTLEGWQPMDPALATFESEAPTGGGGWSLRLTSDGAPSRGAVFTNVPGILDRDVLRLTAFVRAAGQKGGGTIEIVVGRSPTSSRRAVAVGNNEDWTQVSVQYTVNLQEGDQVWVVLSSFNTQVQALTGRFDLIRLERVVL